MFSTKALPATTRTGISYDLLQKFVWWGGSAAVLVPCVLLSSNIIGPVIAYYVVSGLWTMGESWLKLG